jgi:hypothetical protein
MQELARYDKQEEVPALAPWIWLLSLLISLYIYIGLVAGTLEKRIAPTLKD